VDVLLLLEVADAPRRRARGVVDAKRERQSEADQSGGKGVARNRGDTDRARFEFDGEEDAAKTREGRRDTYRGVEFERAETRERTLGRIETEDLTRALAHRIVGDRFELGYHREIWRGDERRARVLRRLRAGGGGRSEAPFTFERTIRRDRRKIRRLSRARRVVAKRHRNVGFVDASTRRGTLRARSARIGRHAEYDQQVSRERRRGVGFVVGKRGVPRRDWTRQSRVEMVPLFIGRRVGTRQRRDGEDVSRDC